MRGKIKIFENELFGKLRVTLNANGQPLFCSKDLCNMLGVKDNWNFIHKSLDSAQYEKHTRDYIMMPYHKKKYAGETLFVNLTGMSKLLSLCHRDDIYEWIVSDVLSYVTKYGLENVSTLSILRDLLKEIQYKFASQDEYYSMKKDYTSMKETFAELQKNLTQLVREKEIWQKEKECLNHHLAEAEYLQYFLERLNRENKSFTATEVGQMFGMSAVQLNKELEKLGIIRRVNGDVVLTSRHMGKHYVDYQPVRKTNSPNEVHQMKWTVKGMAFLYSKMKAAGYRVDSDMELFEAMQCK